MGDTSTDANVRPTTLHTTSPPEVPSVARSLPVHLEQRPPQPRKGRQKSAATGDHELPTEDQDHAPATLPRAPPTIDFTGFRPPSPSHMNGLPNGRKRLLSSESTDDLTTRHKNESESASARARVDDDIQLDPSLRRTGTAMEQTPTDHGAHQGDRRVQLQSEIDGIREALKLKERELAGLL
jgi:hypothetical protein